MCTGKTASETFKQLRAENELLRQQLAEYEQAIKEHKSGTETICLENAWLNKQLAEAKKDADAKQAKIDSLMLEFCPDEMTAEQIAEWAKHQKPYEGDKPC